VNVAMGSITTNANTNTKGGKDGSGSNSGFSGGSGVGSSKASGSATTASKVRGRGRGNSAAKHNANANANASTTANANATSSSSSSGDASKTVFGPAPPPNAKSEGSSTTSTSNSNNKSKDSSSSSSPKSNSNSKTIQMPIDMATLSALNLPMNMANMNMGSVNMNMGSISGVGAVGVNMNMGMNMGVGVGVNAHALNMNMNIPEGLAAAFGDIDVVSMVQSEMMNQFEAMNHMNMANNNGNNGNNGSGGENSSSGNSTSTGSGSAKGGKSSSSGKSESKSKSTSGSAKSENSKTTASSTTSTTTSTSTSSKKNKSSKDNSGKTSSSSSSSNNQQQQQQQQQPQHQRNARDILLNYAAAAAYATQTGNHVPPGVLSPLPSSSTSSSSKYNNSNNDGNGNGVVNSSSAKSSNNANNNTSSSSTSFPTDGPCSDSEMKALMNMFVEIMGMSFDANDKKSGSGSANVNVSSGSGSGNKNNNNSSNSNDKSNSNNNCNDSNSNESGDNINATSAFVKENLARIKFNDFLAAHEAAHENRKKSGGSDASGDGNSNNDANSNSSNGIGSSGSGNNGKSNSNSSNNPFPVFSMMFGGGNTNNGNGGGGDNSNTSPKSTSSGRGSSDKPSASATVKSEMRKIRKTFKKNNINVPCIPPPAGGWPSGVAAVEHDFDDGYDDSEDCYSGDEDVTMDDDDDCSIPELLPAGEGGVGDNYNASSTVPTSSSSSNHHHTNNSSSGKGKTAHQDHSSVNRRNSKSNSIDSGNNASSSSINNPNEYMLDPSTLAAAELLREEEEAVAAANEDEEKAKRAAKKREKKQRKKERARRETAIKTAEAAIKRRERGITSWRSRVVTAFTGGEVKKVESLITENPFKDGKQLQLDPELIEYLDSQPSYDDEIDESMEWLLNSCVIKHSGNGKSENWLDARNKLGSFIVDMAFHIVFKIGRNSISTLHHACLSGDTSFVKIVVNRRRQIESGNTGTKKSVKKSRIPKDFLEAKCEDLGFTPLHYAAVGGWVDVVEVILEGGGNVQAFTDPSRTCRASNRNGLTARDLLQSIISNKYASAVESSGDSFRELVDSRRSGSNETEYIKSLNCLADRLRLIEVNGYVPLSNPDIEVESERENTQQIGKTTAVKSSEQQSKSKKKKKKKKDQNSKAAEPSKPTSSSSNQNTAGDSNSDPLVSALRAMGFSNKQIDEAVLACGGTNRATADDLVMWILEKESSGGVGALGVPSTSEVSNDYDSQNDHTSSFDDPRDLSFEAEERQRRTNELARREAEEAAKRAAEAKAAAERLAAKREEQRRIRREWNNREQVRQQEEAKARMAEEVLRRKQLEAEKASALAQRVAEEQSAVSALSGLPRGNVADGNNVKNTGVAPLFPSTSSVVDQPLLSSSALPQAYIQSVQTDKMLSTPTKHSILEKKSPLKSRSSAPDSEGSSKKRKPRKNRNKKVTSPTPPPPVLSLPTHINTASQHLNEPVYQEPSQYESNPLGEIRATAREFVPTFPTPTPPPLPPGLGLVQSSVQQKRDVEPSFAILPPTTISSNILEAPSSILPNLDRSSTNSSPFPSSGLNLERPESTNPLSQANAVQSATSSISGLSGHGTESSFMPSLVSNRNQEEEFLSSLLDPSISLEAATSAAIGSTALNPLDSGATSATPLGGTSLWGGGTSSVPGSSNLGGMSSFGFAQNSTLDDSFSSHDINPTTVSGASEKKNESSNTWGSFAPPGGGSIW